MFGQMHIYTVHVKPGTAQPPQGKPVFIREGFNWAAFLFTGFWTLYQRLWLPLLLILAFNITVIALREHHMLSIASTLAMQIGFQAFIGYSGNDWLRARLKRRGYVLADIAAADSQLRAEQRYFERYLAAAH